MRHRTLITTGIVGAVVAAVCCATPLLAIVFGALGLTAWLAKADYVRWYLPERFARRDGVVFLFYHDGSPLPRSE